MLSCDNMLRATAAAHALDTAVQKYLHDILGVAVKIGSWAGAGKLPYFLQDAFEIRELKLFDRPILLALDRQTNKPALANVRAQLAKLQVLAAQPFVYVTSALASYERKRLIGQKVPFMVPGNQLYLPDLGIDLRQYFRQRPRAEDAALSPATQALLIVVLLREPWQESWQPAEVVAGLGYTPMTLSRAIKELTSAGIATVHIEGRARRLRMTRPPAQTWEHARPLLGSPVRRRVWARPVPGLQSPFARLAGLSALARHALLAEPQWPVYALSCAQWKAATQAGLQTLAETLSGCCECQVWNYSPALVPHSASVDILSLLLSLQDEVEERVQLALGGLKALLPW
jgi:hypothetical protein